MQGEIRTKIKRDEHVGKEMQGTAWKNDGAEKRVC